MNRHHLKRIAAKIEKAASAEGDPRCVDLKMLEALIKQDRAERKVCIVTRCAKRADASSAKRAQGDFRGEPLPETFVSKWRRERGARLPKGLSRGAEHARGSRFWAMCTGFKRRANAYLRASAIPTFPKLNLRTGRYYPALAEDVWEYANRINQAADARGERSPL